MELPGSCCPGWTVLRWGLREVGRSICHARRGKLGPGRREGSGEEPRRKEGLYGRWPGEEEEGGRDRRGQFATGWVFPEPTPDCQICGAHGHTAPISSHPGLPGRTPLPTSFPTGKHILQIREVPVSPSFLQSSHLKFRELPPDSGWDQSAGSKAGFTLPSEGAACC